MDEAPGCFLVVAFAVVLLCVMSKGCKDFDRDHNTKTARLTSAINEFKWVAPYPTEQSFVGEGVSKITIKNPTIRLDYGDMFITTTYTDGDGAKIDELLASAKDALVTVTIVQSDVK